MTTLRFPPEQWRHQATAFLARCRGQMWGRHKEEPLAWLFRAGFTTSFAESIFLGWNFRPMTRNAGNWLGPDHEKEKIFLPSGLVLPWIHEQKILRLSVVQENGESLVLAGSSTEVMETGREKKKLLLFFSDGDFFRALQENFPDFSLMSAPFPDKILEKDLTPFEKILLISEETEKARTILEELAGRRLPVQAVWLPAKGIIPSILERRLTGERFFRMVSDA